MIWPENRESADKSRGVTHEQAPTRPETRTPEARSAARLAAREFFKVALGYARHSLCRLNVEHVDRDDLAQEIVIAAYLKRREYQPGRASPRQFMHGFVVNYVRNYRRKQHKIKGQIADLPPDFADNVADDAPGMMERYVDEKMRQLLHEQLIPQLEFDLATVVIARDLDDLDFKTIAEEQGIPIATAHDRYQRGILELKAAYERHQRKQKAQGLVVLPFTIGQLLAADRAIPDVPAELVQLTWSRVYRALRWRARWQAFRALLRHKATQLTATLLAGGVLGAVLHAFLQPAPPPAPVVFVQRGPELAPLVELQPAAYEAPPSTAAALPAPLASSTLRRDPSTEQRAFDKAHQAFDRGRLDDALAALAAYEREYPQGAYAVEGETLRARIAQLRAEVTATP